MTVPPVFPVTPTGDEGKLPSPTLQAPLLVSYITPTHGAGHQTGITSSGKRVAGHGMLTQKYGFGGIITHISLPCEAPCDSIDALIWSFRN